jgi:hypothetical protein
MYKYLVSLFGLFSNTEYIKIKKLWLQNIICDIADLHADNIFRNNRWYT